MQEADRIYLLLAATIQQRFPLLPAAFQNHPTTNCNTLPSTDNSHPSPAPSDHSTTHLTQPALSMMERMLINHTRGTNTNWTPHALYWRPTLHQFREQQQLPAHNPACMPGIFTTLVTAPPSTNNTPAASHDTVSGKPFLATHCPWLATCQRHHMHPTQLPWATNVMVLDHKLRPP